MQPTGPVRSTAVAVAVVAVVGLAGCGSGKDKAANADLVTAASADTTPDFCAHYLDVAHALSPELERMGKVFDGTVFTGLASSLDALKARYPQTNADVIAASELVRAQAATVNGNLAAGNYEAASGALDSLRQDVTGVWDTCARVLGPEGVAAITN